MSHWIANAWSDKHPFWPLAEHNQGTLTFLALAAALIIAVYEVRRSARSEQRSLVEYIDFVIGIADYALKNTSDAIKTVDGTAEAIEETPLIIWDFAEGSALASLREVLPVKPAHAELAQAVGTLERVLSVDLEHSIMTQENKREGLLSVLHLIEVAKLRIERVRPKSGFQRIRSDLQGVIRTTTNMIIPCAIS